MAALSSRRSSKMKIDLSNLMNEARVAVPSKRRRTTSPELDRAFWRGDGAREGHLLTIVAPEGVFLRKKMNGKPKPPRISHERLKELVDYDAEKGVFTWKVTRCTRAQVGMRAGSNTKGYWRLCLDGTVYMAHRVAWFYCYGEMPDLEVDHINGDPSDNRIENLRVSSTSQNIMNSKLNSRNTSGIKGVSWFKPQRKWSGYVTLNYKQHHAGYFTTKEDAGHAVKLLREKLHGQFTNHG